MFGVVEFPINLPGTDVVSSVTSSSSASGCAATAASVVSIVRFVAELAVLVSVLATAAKRCLGAVVVVVGFDFEFIVAIA